MIFVYVSCWLRWHDVLEVNYDIYCMVYSMYNVDNDNSFFYRYYKQMVNETNNKIVHHAKHKQNCLTN